LRGAVEQQSPGYKIVARKEAAHPRGDLGRVSTAAVEFGTGLRGHIERNGRLFWRAPVPPSRGVDPVPAGR
jgi:hypothetical protein